MVTESSKQTFTQSGKCFSLLSQRRSLGCQQLRCSQAVLLFLSWRACRRRSQQASELIGTPATEVSAVDRR